MLVAKKVTKQLTKQEVAQIVDNDIILVDVTLKKSAIKKAYNVLSDPTKNDCFKYAKAKGDIGRHIAKVVLGDESCHVHNFEILQENSHEVEVRAKINVSDFLFGCSSGNDLIEGYEMDCVANIAYSNNNKDLYEGEWD